VGGIGLLREIRRTGGHRIEEYPAYNFGAAEVFQAEPAMDTMRTKITLGAALFVALLAAAALLPAGFGAGGARAAESIGPARAVERFVPRQVVLKLKGEPRGHTVGLPRGAGVLATARALRERPEVAYAEPNYLAHASAVETPPTSTPEGPDPNDPGTLETSAATGSATVGGWATKQWDFLPSSGTPTAKLPISPGGIDVTGAWANLEAAGRPGGKGVIVAVLDSGIAYRDWGIAYKRSPDFSPEQFVPGEDFVDHDRLPLDENGHGTHVAGTIAEQTNNGIGLTGIAYGAQLMPVRVLNRGNVGYANRIAEGIRFAVKNHANVINMSFNFGCGEKVPQVDEALREAYAAGVVTVASGGNLSTATSSTKSCVSEPATGPRVIGVGGTTEGACIGSYSLAGKGIDVVAPGGGTPAAGCPSVLSRPIYQVTLQKGLTDEFTIPNWYTGTSMAAAHVSGTVALMLAAGVLPSSLTPKARVRGITRRLESTARNLGYPRTVQGAGLIDAERATER
jgi:serine protease